MSKISILQNKFENYIGKRSVPFADHQKRPLYIGIYAFSQRSSSMTQGQLYAGTVVSNIYQNQCLPGEHNFLEKQEPFYFV